MHVFPDSTLSLGVFRYSWILLGLLRVISLVLGQLLEWSRAKYPNHVSDE